MSSHRHAHDAPREVARVGTTIEHAAEPVQSAASGLEPRTDFHAGAEIWSNASPPASNRRSVAPRLVEMLGADLRLFVRARDVHGLLKMIEQSARVSVGGFDQYGLRIGRDGVLCRFTGANATKSAKSCSLKDCKDIYGSTREQRIIDLE